MARRRFFRRRSSGGRRRRRMGKRAVGGKLGRFVNGLIKRPLRAIAGILGLAAVATVFVEPDQNGFSVVDDVTTMIKDKNYAAAKNIPGHLINGVMSGKWIGPAIGSAVTALISRALKA